MKLFTFLLALALLCLPVSADQLLLTAQYESCCGFSSLVQSPLGIRVAYIVGHNTTEFDSASVPNLFRSIGLISPSSSPQIFTATSSDENFDVIASMLARSSRPLEAIVMANKAEDVPPSAGRFPHWNGHPDGRIPSLLWWPESTITSIELTISPFSWITNNSGSHWPRQPNGEMVTATLSMYGSPGVDPLPPRVPETVPTKIAPESSTLSLLALGLLGLMSRKP